MAEIDLEQKKRPVWPWIILLIVVVLLIWWLVTAMGDREEAAGVAAPQVDTAPAVDLPEPAPDIAAIIRNPDEHFDHAISGTFRVVEVPTDRGFWLGDGERLFAIVIDEPEEQPVDINPGQLLRLSGALVRPQDASRMPGQTFDDATSRIISEQPIVLAVEESGIEIVERGSPQPGTDPAQTAPSGPPPEGSQ